MREALNSEDKKTKLKSQIENFVKPLFENTGSGKSGDSTRTGQNTTGKKQEKSEKSEKSKKQPGGQEKDQEKYPPKNETIIEEVKHAEYIISDPGTQSIIKMIKIKMIKDIPNASDEIISKEHNDFKNKFYKSLYLSNR